MKKTEKSENYLEKTPVRMQDLQWTEENGTVTLHIENKGVMNRIMQLLIKKPKVSHIHLDELGSMAWLLIDGKRSIADIGTLVEEKFGEKAHPTYERLARYFSILESNGFISFDKD